MREYGAEFVDQLCTVRTNDNQNFTIDINPWFVWSDGTPVTMDDVYFTYSSIIAGNARSLPIFNIYADIKIEKTSDTSMTIAFSKRSIDNKLFFTYNILPRHILSDRTFEFYKNDFAQSPIYTKCAHLNPSSDINSLVFDLGKCSNTKLWFYQIKNTKSFEELKQDYAITKKSIIDAYQFGEWLEWYEEQPIITHAYTTLFFNTQSDKLRVRLRRALAWLINYNFYTGSYENFIWKDQWIFDNFMSTWSNIEDFLTRLTPDGNISADELEESGVTALTGRSIQFNEKNRRISYYINEKPFSIELDITASNAYESIGIMYGDTDKWSISSYNKTKKTAKHTIAMRDIKSWINTFTLYTKDKDKTINLGSVTIYLLDKKSEETTEGKPATTLTIIYQNTIPTQKVVAHLKEVFTNMNIADFFVFEPIGTKTEMEAKIVENTYDIALIPIERWLRRDLSPILKSEDPTINPSQYVNPQLTSLFEQYIQYDNDNKAIRDQIVGIYTRDIPFMILGKQVDSVFVKPDIYQTVFAEYTWLVFENTWREMIYTNLSRARSMHIDTENIWWLWAFRQFIRKNIFWSNQEQEENDIYIDSETGTAI